MNKSQIEHKREIESEIISLFNKQNQVEATKIVLKLGQEGASHEFDLYMPEKFIGGISTSPWTNKTPRRSTNTGGQDRVSTELLWLNLWEGNEHRIIILTDREMADRLLKRWRGCAFPHQVEIIHYDLSVKYFETVGKL
ncbi:hypothetical protein ACFLXD_03095 [Chloroflexota bacterium]